MKYSTLGTSEANFEGKKTCVILREVRYLNLRLYRKWIPKRAAYRFIGILQCFSTIFTKRNNFS